jgi:trehalose/maltose hydrolase-like predicted phosphorylase
MPSQWLHVFVGEDPADEGRREALSTLGNGYMGVRGAAPEHDADGVHYPGTYVAGCFALWLNPFGRPSLASWSLM